MAPKEKSISTYQPEWQTQDSFVKWGSFRTQEVYDRDGALVPDVLFNPCTMYDGDGKEVPEPDWRCYAAQVGETLPGSNAVAGEEAVVGGKGHQSFAWWGIREEPLLVKEVKAHVFVKQRQAEEERRRKIEEEQLRQRQEEQRRQHEQWERENRKRLDEEARVREIERKKKEAEDARARETSAEQSKLRAMREEQSRKLGQLELPSNASARKDQPPKTSPIKNRFQSNPNHSRAMHHSNSYELAAPPGRDRAYLLSLPVPPPLPPQQPKPTNYEERAPAINHEERAPAINYEERAPAAHSDRLRESYSSAKPSNKDRGGDNYRGYGYSSGYRDRRNDRRDDERGYRERDDRGRGGGGRDDRDRDRDRDRKSSHQKEKRDDGGDRDRRHYNHSNGYHDKERRRSVSRDRRDSSRDRRDRDRDTRDRKY